MSQPECDRGMQECITFDRAEWLNCKQLNEFTVVQHVSVMTWNVLGKSNLSTVAESCAHYEWEGRFQKMKRILAQANADVICLQEVDQCTYLEDFKPFLSNLGYESVYEIRKKMKGGECVKLISSCAIFYKRKLFELVETEEPFRGVIAKLKILTGEECGKSLSVANCHLEGAPWKGEARLHQMSSVIRRIERLNSEFQIICGDFNEAPNLQVCTKLLPNANFTRAYAMRSDFDATYVRTPNRRIDKEAAFSSCVDHIFSNASLEVCALQNFFDSTWNRDEMIWEGFPSSHWPSDHLNVSAVFKFTPIKKALVEVRSVEECQIELEQKLKESVSKEQFIRWSELCKEIIRKCENCSGKKMCVECRENTKEHQKVKQEFLSHFEENIRAILKRWNRLNLKITTACPVPAEPVAT